jgi:hypothetical protein
MTFIFTNVTIKSPLFLLVDDAILLSFPPYDSGVRADRLLLCTH